jgi:non-ribosomal peptide synthetase component E (peptide arylation enzyme)
MKPTRYDEGEIERYLNEGHWEHTILPDWWEWNAKRFPSREAIVDPEGKRLTWSEALKLVDRIALAFVKALGIEKDARLMVQLPNWVEHILVRLACEKAGILSIPIMPTFRHRELEWIAGQTEAVGIVIPAEYRGFDYLEMVKEVSEKIPSLEHIIVAGEGEAVSLSEFMEHPYEEEFDVGELESRKFDPIHEVGFLLTTTGTTGMPKIIEHRIAAREIWTARTHTRNWLLTPQDVVMALAPLAGAAGGTPAYVTAPVAAAKIALGYEYWVDEALEFMEKERVTLLSLVPTQLIRLLQANPESYDLSSLRIIRCSGGYLPPSVAKEAEERFGALVLGAFGTQDTGSISGVPYWAPPEKRYTTVGVPHPGVEIRVLDKDGKEVELGEPGVLWFRGPGNSCGYWKDPVKTFTEAYDKEGWATTGDIVTLTADGWLKILGREKDIIIRGGQNIFPREIEELLLTHPKVSDVAVIGMPDKEMGERACAFIVPKKGESFTFDEMVEFLKSKKIARFKIPERLELIDSMPLAGGQKIDRKVLVRLVTEKLKQEGKITDEDLRDLGREELIGQG